MRKLAITTFVGILILGFAFVPEFSRAAPADRIQSRVVVVTPVVNEGFEGAFPPSGWSATGHWGKSTCEASSSTASAWAEGASGKPCTGLDSIYDPNETSQLKYGPFDLTGAVTATLTFDAWLWSSQGDSFAWSASIDGSHFYGLSVTNVFSPSWTSLTLDLASVPTIGDLRNQPNVWIAFTWNTDSTFETFAGAYIDNVLVSKGVADGPATPTSTATSTPTPTATPTQTGTPSGLSYLPNVIRALAPTATPTRTPTPTVTPTNSPGNHAPKFPTPLQTSSSTALQYDENGRVVGAVTTITVLTPATDADGDAISYSWLASNGSISGTGLTGIWTRVMSGGKPQGGTASVVASDGKGGTAKADFVFP